MQICPCEDIHCLPYLHRRRLERSAAFCIHKSDLTIRPIWDRKEDRVQAHILVCFLAFVLWKTLAQRCQQAGLGHEPRCVLEQLSKINVVDVILPTHRHPQTLYHSAQRTPDYSATKARIKSAKKLETAQMQ